MKQLEYDIVRSPKRATLTITVERDRTIVVHVPESMPENELRRIVDAKRQWILGKLRHPQKYRDRVHPPGKEMVNGESALYLGREYRIEITHTDSDEVEFSDSFLVPLSRQAKRSEALREWYVERAKKEIIPRAAQHAHQLGVGYKSARVVDNRFRWGSCTAKNNLSFNWRLIKAPMFVIDYVIVHELAHLLEPNHTQRFWNIVRTQTPTMDKAKTWLKEHGQLLEEDV